MTHDSSASRRAPIFLFLGAASVLITLASSMMLASKARAADSEEATVVADQIRRQGYTCLEPAQAVRDAKDSTVYNAAWTLRCKNASYRVRLVPDGAAKVQRLDRDRSTRRQESG